jgi:hypothetical protein
MESEQSQNFNERLSQWVANQGFWFQIRYSMTGSGTAGTAVFHLMRLGSRLLIFLLIIAVGGWIYLLKTTDSAKFSDDIEKKLKSGLFASETELKGFSRSQGELTINRLTCQGGDETFFTSLEARDIHCKMGLLDGVVGQWDTGAVSIARLDMELRAGADDAESAQMLSKALFNVPQKILVNTLEVADASLQWGYSERTRGSIENSDLKIQRQGGGWKMSFRGGRFSQNWLRRLEIVSLVISCDTDGILFEKAELRGGGGTLDFSGLKVTGGERPLIEGNAKICSLPLASILPAALRNFVDGSISGNFKVSGSTNSPEGVGFEGTTTLEGQDTLTLRDRIYLLKALSGVDYVRNYHRVDFNEGSLHIKTTAGGMVVTNVNLKANELLTLAGDMSVRLPTPEETKAALEKDAETGGAPIFDGDDPVLDEVGSKKVDDKDFTLRRAAMAAKRAKEGGSKNEAGQLSKRLELNSDGRQLQAQASERLSKTLRYEGSFDISILPDAFDTAPKLLAHYPVDKETGRIPIKVPIEGGIYEITLKQGEDIYQLREGGTR